MTKQSEQSDQAHSMLLAALRSSDTQALYNTRNKTLANTQIDKLINAIDKYTDRLTQYISSKTSANHNAPNKFDQIKGFREQYLGDLDNPNLGSTHHVNLTRVRNSQYKLNPKFCATVDKLYVLNKLKGALQEEDKSPTQRLNTFRQLLNNADSVKTLTRRRDSGFVTFIKGVAVALGTTLLLAPGYLAYKKLFSRSSTKGADLINDLKTQAPNTDDAAATAPPRQ